MYKKIKRLIKEAVLRIKGLYLIKKNNTYFDPPSYWIERIIKEDYINIIQVGSNDGISGDPLYNLIKKNINWEVLFIEPVPYLFEKLKKNYQNQPRFRFENVAINDGSWQDFYSVNGSAKNDIPNLPKWFDQLGSFKRENITKHLNGVLEPYIIETRTKGVTLPDILETNKIESIDLLHIDAEGYDWIVLSQLDLKIFTPKIILYEHKHLTSQEIEQSLKYLKLHKYAVFKLGCDFICINRRTVSRGILKKLKGVKII